MSGRKKYEVKKAAFKLISGPRPATPASQSESWGKHPTFLPFTISLPFLLPSGVQCESSEPPISIEVFFRFALFPVLVTSCYFKFSPLFASDIL